MTDRAHVCTKKLTRTLKQMNNIRGICFTVVLCAVLLTSTKTWAMAFTSSKKDQDVKTAELKRIPVILDTDIGDDIDDTWALTFLLKCPELDVKLITTCTGDTALRAEMIAKALEMCGRTDIPIGIGVPTGREDIHKYFQRSWLKDYDYSSYAGVVYEDGVQAMIDTIMKSDEPVTILAIGPLPNLAKAIKKQPLIAQKSKIVGMQGAIYCGYGNSTKVVPEWNVRTYIKDAQDVFSSEWPMLITPLDTCGSIRLQDDDYSKVFNSSAPAAKTVISGYSAWMARPGFKPDKRWDVEKNTTVLFDTLAIYLAISTEWVEMENLGVKVDDKGYTRIDENAKKVNCATKWIDKKAFKDMLVERLTD